MDCKAPNSNKRNVKYTWLGVFYLAVINVDNMTLIISTTEEMELGHSPENTMKKMNDNEE